MSELLTAAKNGYYNQVVSLLNCQSCDVNARDKDKATPLYWSASRGHAKICQELVLAGCDVNACVKWGSTALHAAADRGHADCLTVLLNSGADVQIQNERGDTALHLAAYRGYRDLVELLVTTGRADPFLKNNQSKTPLQEAQSQQHNATAKALQHYMESLGCHRFKSLPMSDSSSRQVASPQEQPSSSTPAQSWPRYQSFPKFPDPSLLTDMARPHTHPQLINNLSQGAGSLAGSADASLLFQGPGRSEAGTDTLTGIAGLRGLPGFVTSPGERLHPFHRDPQENVDEGVDYGRVQAVRDVHREQQDRHLDVGGEARGQGLPHYPRNGVGLNQLSAPPSSGHVLDIDGGTNASSGGPQVRHSAQSSSSSSSSAVWRHQNGKGGVHGGSHTYGYEADFHPPVMTPPPHRRQQQSFVRHEDLTLFAESLQLEVVKLRDSLSGKELRVAELENIVSSLKTQNTQLQQVMAEKQSRLKDMLASKESEIAELARRLQETERHNLCLQQALAERQESSNQMSAESESKVLELTARVSDLDRLNRSLQQLLSTHQETMKGALASKDLELAAWKGKVTALTPKTVVDTGTSCPSTGKLAGRDQPTTSTGNHRHSVDDSESGKEFLHKQDSSKSSAKTSVCDGSETHPIQQTPLPQTQCGVIRSSDPSHKTEAHVTAAPGMSPKDSASMGTHPGYKSKPDSAGLLQCQLRASVARLFQDPAHTWKLDADGREWTEGREFQLLDAKPVNCGSDGERRGSCSLVFSIQHQGRKYMLKMLTNLINLSCEAHSQGRSLDAHLLHCFGAEFHAPLLLHQHANVVRVRHHYQGDTRRFSGYLRLLVPPTLDVPVDMARRTTFLVLDHYPLTLQSFAERLWRSEDARHDQRRPGTAQGQGRGQGQGQTGIQGQGQGQTRMPGQGQGQGQTRAQVQGQTKVQVQGQDQGQTRMQAQGQGQTRVQAQAQAQAQSQETHGGGFRQSERQNLPEGKSVEQQFLLQVVYQLLSAVDFLQRHEVVHRDIKADNVFLDWRLRPVLGDFGLARTLQGYRGQTLAPFTDRGQVLAGNSHAWAPELCRWSRVDPATLTQPITLKDIYSKSDGFAVARMFYHLFGRSSYNNNNNNNNNKDADDSDDKSSNSSNNSSNSSNSSSNGSEDWFPTSTLQQPHYADSAVRLLQGPVCEGLAHVLRSMVLDNPADRPSVRQALCRVGVLLFRPEGQLTMVDQAEEFFTSQLQQLSALSSPSEVSRAREPEEGTLSMAESVAANQNHCLADFLLTFSGEEFWEAYREMRNLGF